MNKRTLRADFLLLLTAAIWGFGFVAQRSGMDHVGPFTFNGVRFILGSLFLLPIILIRKRSSTAGVESPPAKKLFLYSFVAGSCLFLGITLQQFGIMFTTTGNAGFITGLYVVLTPIFAIFLGKRTGPATWFGAVFALSGLYFLTAVGRMDSINPGDILVMGSAVFWALHVLIIDRLVRDTDPLILASGQSAVCGLMAIAGAFLVEPFIHPLMAWIDPALLEAGTFGWLPLPSLIAGLYANVVALPAEALIPILYSGICSTGIANTLQVIAQKDVPPAHATIILCFESSFAALGGVLLFSERVGGWTLLGFSLMLAGMLVTQWGTHKRRTVP